MEYCKRFLIFGFLICTISACKKEDVTKYAAIETYPEDTILQILEVKKAMVMVAHDDDMSTMTGTISSMVNNSWEIRVISISQGETRDNAHKRAGKDLGIEVDFFDFTEAEFRKDQPENKYEAVPKSELARIFNPALVQKEILNEVNQFQPSVIFTLDNEIGGYGHPEHVFISQQVLDLTRVDSISVDFIYQSVYTKHMETSIMERHSRRMKDWGFAGDGWDKAKAAYGVEGMPEPTVQINITGEGKAKMKFLRSYNKSEQKNLEFFIPAFENYSAEEYFEIFNREFFRVIEI